MRCVRGQIVVVVLVSAMNWASAASAATVGSITGEVSVNRGDGFRRISNSSTARSGDSVMVGSNSSAQVSYDDGCVVNINPGAVYTVTETSPCSSNAQQSAQSGPTTGQIAIGSALIVGAGVGIYFLTKKDSASSP
jgi:hypothetical protein